MLICYYFFKDMICDEMLIFQYVVAQFNCLKREIKKICCIMDSNCNNSSAWGFTDFRGYPNEEGLYSDEIKSLESWLVITYRKSGFKSPLLINDSAETTGAVYRRRRLELLSRSV